ncbi:MAG: family 78 glycoside hydrolase catalytic domain [Pedobacter sp.]|uniref:family 78 glycoside hydrolase catalytic domain n=1 Tax=Pedobacter sp. TaxID=1411316 RepID=UPI0035628BBE
MLVKKIIALFLIQFVAVVAFAQKLGVSDLTVNYKTNPIGIDAQDLHFSWKLNSQEKQTMQNSYELRLATQKESLSKNQNLTWESGKVDNKQSLHIAYAGSPLKSKQRYYWQVRITDNHKNSSAWSEVQYFETGVGRSSEWTAKWIEAEEITDGASGPVPTFFKSFNISAPIKDARLYITAHGIYEAKLNGKNISESLLTPGWTSYKKRLQYQTYDVTSMLTTGENAAVVSIGDGWYRGFLQWNKKRNWYGKEVGLLYQLEITTADGKKQVINSDGNWKSSFEGPIKAADIYNGETFDSRLDLPINAKTTAKWKGVRVVETSLDNLVPQESPAVIRKEQFKPLKFIKTPKGETVVDFGQNLVGWVQIKVKGKSGEILKINHAEVLDKEGNFYTSNLRSALQENTFILNGKEQFLEPRFTFQGFRYIKITYPGKLDESNLTAVAIYSDMAPTGFFTSSDKQINQLQHNIQWGQKGNFVDVPTDCPQRDERLGWTGDAQVFFNTAAYNMNVSTFFKKWLGDLKADQYENGRVPAVIPITHMRGTDGSAGWADAATIIPWDFYWVYGDKGILSAQYASMKKWVDYMSSVANNNLWNNGTHYGDWLFYTMADDRDGKAAITDKHLIAQTFYAASTQNMINAAEVLGNKDDVAKYTDLLEKVKTAFLKEYVTPSGRLVSNSQTAYVLALNFDMLPESLRAQAAARLVENIKSYKNHITTGFLGTPYICHVLSRFGYDDVAYALLFQETYPSWLYPVKMGATTIWERWDGIKTDGSFQNTSMNSFNHYAYGAIGDWMYKRVAGLRAADAGYKKIWIEPSPGGKFSNATAKLETPYGTAQSSWKIENGKFILDVIIPVNTQATIVFPHSSGAKITENNNAIEGLKYLKKRKGDSKNESVELGSGTYHFEYLMSK